MGADVVSTAYYIVPTGHSHTKVDCDRYGRSIRKDEFYVFEFAAPSPVLGQRDPSEVLSFVLHCHLDHTHQPAPLQNGSANCFGRRRCWRKPVPQSVSHDHCPCMLFQRRHDKSPFASHAESAA